MIMPSYIDAAIQEMLKSGMIQVVNALADKYNFDAFEANLFVNTIDAKIVRERDPSPKKEKDTNMSTKNSKVKKEKKEDKPKKKRGMTGYLLFSKENRATVKEELGDVKPTEVVTEVAKRWKALSDEEREEWNTRAKDGQEVEVEVSED